MMENLRAKRGELDRLKSAQLSLVMLHSHRHVLVVGSWAGAYLWGGYWRRHFDGGALNACMF